MYLCICMTIPLLEINMYAQHVIELALLIVSFNVMNMLVSVPKYVILSRVLRIRKYTSDKF